MLTDGLSPEKVKDIQGIIETIAIKENKKEIVQEANISMSQLNHCVQKPKEILLAKIIGVLIFNWTSFYKKWGSFYGRCLSFL